MNIKLLTKTAKIPIKKTTGSAGYDMFCDIESPVLIKSGETVKISTGVAIEMEDNNHVALIFARSSMGVTHGIVPANAVGVIDSDYRGDIIVALHNNSKIDYTVGVGDRIAQMVILPISTPNLTIVDELSDTIRGDGGFGSTGIK